MVPPKPRIENPPQAKIENMQNPETESNSKPILENSPKENKQAEKQLPQEDNKKTVQQAEGNQKKKPQARAYTSVRSDIVHDVLIEQEVEKKR